MCHPGEVVSRHARPALQLAERVKRFGPVTAVDRVSSTLPAGRCPWAPRAERAGTTTLLRMVLGLVRPDSGEIRLWGRSPGTERLPGVAGFTDWPSFPPYLSGRRNLELLARLDDASTGPALHRTVAESLDRCSPPTRRVGWWSPPAGPSWASS